MTSNGIDAASKLAPEHAALLDGLKDQLLIAFLRRLGGKVSIPTRELEGVIGLGMAFNIEAGVFNFEIMKKP